MTPEEIRDRLAQVPARSFTGGTADRFRKLYQLTGLSWRQVLQYYADIGFRWKDAAQFFEMHPTTLQAYAYKRQVNFGFNGHRHPETMAAREKDQKQNPAKYRRFHNRANYRAFGKTASLEELLQEFGHESLNWACVNSRINRGWPVEDALTLPNGQPSGSASIWRDTG